MRLRGDGPAGTRRVRRRKGVFRGYQRIHSHDLRRPLVGDLQSPTVEGGAEALQSN